MKCYICGIEIKSKEDIHWQEDVMVCSACYERAVDDSREVTPGGQND